LSPHSCSFASFLTFLLFFTCLIFESPPSSHLIVQTSSPLGTVQAKIFTLCLFTTPMLLYLSLFRSCLTSFTCGLLPPPSHLPKTYSRGQPCWFSSRREHLEQDPLAWPSEAGFKVLSIPYTPLFLPLTSLAAMPPSCFFHAVFSAAPPSPTEVRNARDSYGMVLIPQVPLFPPCERSRIPDRLLPAFSLFLTLLLPVVPQPRSHTSRRRTGLSSPIFLEVRSEDFRFPAFGSSMKIYPPSWTPCSRRDYLFHHARALDPKLSQSFLASFFWQVIN